MKLKNLFQKLHSEKGITGADVAVSICVIVLTIGVVTSIYVNSTNKSKEELRYSAATRIATNLAEKIQDATYDELVYRCDNSYNSSNRNEDGNIFGINVPVGYSAEVLAPKISGATVDVVRDVTINVTYEISNNTKTITLYLTKEKELLEQTNRPNLNLIENYTDSNFYAIKYTGSNYIVTATSDPDWYNYDDGYYALVLYSANSYEFGDVIPISTVTTGDLYVWIPRFGLDSSSKLSYCYGTSGYKITFSLFDNSLYGYMLTGKGNNGNYTVDGISSYVSGTFVANDGKSGVWYKPNGANADMVVSSYNALNSYKAKANF